jgi:hypothetical protein
MRAAEAVRRRNGSRPKCPSGGLLGRELWNSTPEARELILWRLLINRPSAAHLSFGLYAMAR